MRRPEPSSRCDRCSTDVPSYDTVHTTIDSHPRLLCNRCFNALVAERSGVDFEHPEFAPVVLEDAAGERHAFHFRTRLGGDHVAVEAFEIQDGSPGGYQFQVLGDADADVLATFQQLFERMRRALRRRHVEDGEVGAQIVKSDEGWILRGQIEWDEEEDGRVPRLVIDGRSYTWDEVGRMLTSFEGFHVKLEVHDKSEER